MGLADDLRLGPPETVDACRVAVLKQNLTPEDLAVFQESLVLVAYRPWRERSTSHSGHTVTWLVGVLKKHGLQVSRDALSRHVRGVCSCGAL